MKWLTKTFLKVWPILVIIAVSFAYHINLFLPHPSIYITPDYARSDLIHSKQPTQYVMWKALRERHLPLWEKGIYQGYPEIDGLEMGFFYTPNLVSFGLLPFWLAFNLSYIINAIVAGLGVYLFTRSFKINQFGALIAALTFSYSPIFTLHYHHYNLILAISWIPWLYLLVNSFFNTRKYIFLSLIPVVVAEQYFAGSPQIPTYNLFFLFIFFLFKLNQANLNRILNIKLSLLLLFAILLGFSIASIQLIPTYKLLINSKWIEAINPESILTQFPFKVKSLLTVIDPYILGNPKYGTYPPWVPGKWGIFWESNFYFGFTQLAILVSSIFFYFRKKFNKSLSLYIFWSSLFIIGILLSLGTQSPLHPIFSIPPFSFFRVPSRFLFISFFALSQIVALTVNALEKNNKNKKIYPYVTLFLLLVIIADIFRVWFPYNMVGSVEKWFAPPQLASSIKEGRLIDIGQYELWNRTFLKKGWSNQEEEHFYYYYRNFLSANLNLFFNLQQLYGYESFVPKRTRLIEQLSKSDNVVEKNELKIGKASQKVLNFSNVRYLTTPYEVNSEDWILSNQIEKDGSKIYLYNNKKYMPNAFIVNDYKVAKTVNDFNQIIFSDNFDPKKIAILEEDVNIDKTNEIPTENNISMMESNNTKVSLHAITVKKSILVLSDSYYEGWHAYIDGKETKIFPANGNSRALVVPPGDHKILFQYKPSIIYKGFIASIVSLLIYLLLLFILRNKFEKAIKIT